MTKLYFAVDDGLAKVTLEDERDYGRLDLLLNGHDVRCVATDPLRPEFVYSGTFDSGLWCSRDAGKTWQEAGRGITHTQVQSVAVSRSERAADGRGVVYAGTEPSAVFRSEDAGETWWQCPGLDDLPSAGEWSFPPRPETHHARYIAPDPHHPGRLFVAIEAGALVRSPDAGHTWQDRVPDGPYDTHELAIHLSTPGRLYSAAGDGYLESYDGGNTWQRFEKGLEHSKYVWSIAVDTGDADNIILSSAPSPMHSHYKPAESHLYRRKGGIGAPWQELREGLPEPKGRHTAVLAAHPHESGVIIAAWEDGVFRSADGGASWGRIEMGWPEGMRIEEMCPLAVGVE